MENTTVAYISLGGNLGDEAARFARALDMLEALPGIRLRAVSRLYRTEPQGDANQPWFSNQVAALTCAPEIIPAGLLRSMLAIEEQLGRVRDPHRRFGPRAIDLDLLLFGDMVCAEEKVHLPHPRMNERAFVLVPLLDIAPSLTLPDGTPVRSSLEKLRFRVAKNTIFQEETVENGKSK
ncbi:MAG: 2-amino-4-hydroxy-6-hydroxymethyldihydropteridine diphosphokinase [Deltaproteobacteria bacterium]|nr:2-amino-4-hydroxy-6-hydroxymethyldihydropteridine diphosphokinase [Deltaproteobacteria bacterium]